MRCGRFAGGCGGSHGSLAPLPMQSTAPQSTYTGPMVQAMFTITIPATPASSSTARGTAAVRKPAYVSSSTTKIVFKLNSATDGLTVTQINSINSTYLGSKPITVPSSTCVASGSDYVCTIALVLPPGDDNLTISAEDGSSNILSQQTQTFSVTAGIANSLSVTLDAQVGPVATSVSVSTSGQSTEYLATTATNPIADSSTVAILSPHSGSNAQTFTVTIKDQDGKTIVGPGLPTLAVTRSAGEISASNVVQRRRHFRSD